MKIKEDKKSQKTSQGPQRLFSQLNQMNTQQIQEQGQYEVPIDPQQLLRSYSRRVLRYKRTAKTYHIHFVTKLVHLVAMLVQHYLTQPAYKDMIQIFPHFLWTVLTFMYTVLFAIRDPHRLNQKFTLLCFEITKYTIYSKLMTVIMSTLALKSAFSGLSTLNIIILTIYLILYALTLRLIIILYSLQKLASYRLNQLQQQRCFFVQTPMNFEGSQVQLIQRSGVISQSDMQMIKQPIKRFYKKKATLEMQEDSDSIQKQIYSL